MQDYPVCEFLCEDHSMITNFTAVLTSPSHPPIHD
jgi:hypothetical protein